MNSHQTVIFFALDFICVDNVVDETDIAKHYRNVIFVKGEDGALLKYVLAEPIKRPSDKKPPPPPPKPKAYEVKAAAMPGCSVSLLQMTKNDIDAMQKKVKREYKVEKIQNELKSLPILKICDFVRFAVVIEPNLQFLDDDIAFESVSDDTLQLMYLYMFPIEEDNTDYFDEDFQYSCENSNDIATTQLVGVRNYNCEVDPFSELFIGNWFNMEKFLFNMMCENDAFSNDIDKSVVANYQLDWLAKLQNDGYLTIHLPEVNGSRSSLLISNEMLCNLFASLSMTTTPKEIDASVMADESRINVIDDKMLAMLFAKAIEICFGPKMNISTDCGAAVIDDQNDTMLSVSSNS